MGPGPALRCRAMDPRRSVPSVNRVADALAGLPHPLLVDWRVKQ